MEKDERGGKNEIDEVLKTMGSGSKDSWSLGLDKKGDFKSAVKELDKGRGNDSLKNNSISWINVV